MEQSQAMAEPQSRPAGPAEAAARQQADALCKRLIARGDPLSFEAACVVGGTLEAFATLVNDKMELTRQLMEANRNLAALQVLWARVPAQARHLAAHGKHEQ